MNANLLVDSLPDTVEVNGQEYKIRTDFRIGVLFELVMEDDELSQYEKLFSAINLYYEEPPDDLIEAFKQALWFYQCGKTQKTAIRGDEDEEAPEDRGRTPIAYSFEYDDAYIYASFLKEYGIDLTEEDLHWWKFRALFKALPEDSQIVKIMGYRTAKINDNMSKAEKDFIRKMKKLYALPLSDKEIEYQSKLTDALMNGGDLRGLLDG